MMMFRNLVEIDLNYKEINNDLASLLNVIDFENALVKEMIEWNNSKCYFLSKEKIINRWEKIEKSDLEYISIYIGNNEFKLIDNINDSKNLSLLREQKIKYLIICDIYESKVIFYCNKKDKTYKDIVRFIKEIKKQNRKNFFNKVKRQGLDLMEKWK